MFEKLANLFGYSYRQGIISYKNGRVSIAHIKFEGVTIVVRDGYIEIREQGDWGDESIPNLYPRHKSAAQKLYETIN